MKGQLASCRLPFQRSLAVQLGHQRSESLDPEQDVDVVDADLDPLNQLLDDAGPAFLTGCDLK